MQRQRQEVVPAEKLHSLSRLYDHRIQHLQDTLRDSLHKVDQDEVVRLQASDNSTVQYALERVHEIVEGGVFLEREAYVKQQLNRVGDIESEQSAKDEDMSQLHSEWEEFRKQVALKTDLEAQRDSVLREELERQQEVSEVSDKRNTELESRVKELQQLLESEKRKGNMTHEQFERENRELREQNAALQAQVVERDMHDRATKEALISDSLATERSKTVQQQEQVTALRIVIEEKDNEQILKNAKIKQLVELGEELTQQIEELQQEDAPNKALMDAQMALDLEKEQNLKLGKELKDALVRLDVTTSQLALVPREEAIQQRLHQESHSPSQDLNMLSTVNQLETELRYTKNQCNDLERALLHERAVHADTGIQQQQKSTLLASLEVKTKNLEEERYKLVVASQNQESNNERKLVLLESEVGRVRGLAASEHEGMEQRVSTLVKDVEHWRNQCERAVREAERLDQARAEATAKYALQGSRVEELVQAHAKDLSDCEEQHIAEKEELLQELHVMQEQIHSSREKSNHGRQEARERVDLAQRKVTQLQSDLKVCTLEQEKLTEENSKLAKAHANCDTIKSSLEKAVQSAELEVSDQKREQRILNIKVKELSCIVEEKDSDMDMIRRSSDRASEARVTEEVSKMKIACSNEIREVHDKFSVQLASMQKSKRELEGEQEQARAEQERMLRARDQEWRGRMRDLEQNVRDTETVRVEAMVAEAKREIVEKSLLPEVVQSREARLRTEYEGAISKLKREAEDIDMQRKAALMKALDDQKGHFGKSMEENRRVHAEEVEKLRKKLVELKQMHDQLEKEKTGEIESLKKSIALKESEIRRLQSKFEEESVRFQKEQDSMREKNKAQNSDYDLKLHGFEDNLRKMQSTVESEKHNTKRQEEIVSQQQARLQENRSVYDSLMSEKTDLEKRLGVIMKESSTTTERSHELEAENSDQRVVLGSVNDEMLKLRDVLSVREDDVALLQSQEQKLGDALLGLQAKLDEVKDQKEQQAIEKGELQVHIADLESELKSCKNQLDGAVAGKQSAETDIQLQQQERKSQETHAYESELDLIAKLERTETVLSEQKERLEAKVEECSVQHVDLDKLKSYCVELEHLVANLQAQGVKYELMADTLSSSQKQVVDLENRVVELEQQLVQNDTIATNSALEAIKGEIELLQAVERRNLSQIEDLHIDLREQQTQVAQLEDTVCKGNEKSNLLAIELDDEHARLEALREELNTVQGEFIKANTVIKEQEAENDQLSLEIDKLHKKDKKELEEAMQVCEDTLGRAEGRKAEYESHVQELSQHISELQLYAQAQNTRVSVLVSEKDVLSEELSVLRTTLTNSEKQYTMTQATVSDLEGELQQLSKNVQRLRTQLEQQEQEQEEKEMKQKNKIASLSREADQNSSDKRAAEIALSTITQDFELSQEKCLLVQNKNTSLVAQVSDLQQELAALRSQCDGYIKNHENVQTDKRALESSLVDTEAARKKLIEELRECNRLCEVLETNVAGLDSENVSLRASIAKLEGSKLLTASQLELLQTEITQLTAELATAVSEKTEQTNSNGQFLQKYEEFGTKVSNLEAEHDRLSSTVNTLTCSLSDAEIEKSNLQSTLAVMAAEKEQMVVSHSKSVLLLEEQIMKLENGNKRSETTSEELQMRVKTLESSLQAKQETLEQAKNDFYTTSDQLVQLRSIEKMHADLSKELNDKTMHITDITRKIQEQGETITAQEQHISKLSLDIAKANEERERADIAVSDLRSDLAEYKSAKMECDKLQAVLNEKYQESLVQMDKLEREMVSVIKRNSEEKEQLISKYNTDFHQVTNKHAQELERLTAFNEAKLAEIKQDSNLKHTTTLSGFEAQIQSAKMEYERDAIRRDNEHKNEIVKLGNDHSMQIAQMVNEHHNAIVKLENEHKSEISTLLSSQQNDKTRLTNEHQSVTQKMTIDHQTEINRAKLEAQAVQEQLRQEQSKSVSSLEQKLVDQKTKIEALYLDLNKYQLLAKEMEQRAQHNELGVSEKKVVIEQLNLVRDQLLQEKRVLEAKCEGLVSTNHQQHHQQSVLEAKQSGGEALIHTQLQLDKASREVVGLTEALGLTQQELTQLQHKHGLIESQYQTKIVEKTKYISELEHKEDEQQQQCVVHSIEAARLQVTCDAQEQTLLDLREKQAKYRGRGEQLQSQVQSHLQKDISRWEEKYTKSQRYVAELEGVVSELNHEAQQQRAKENDKEIIAQLQAHISQLELRQSDLDGKLHEKSLLVQQSATKLSNFDLLTQRVVELQSTTQQQQAELHQAHAQKLRLQRKIEEYRTRLQSAEQFNTDNGESMQTIAAEIDLQRRAAMQ